MHHTLWRGELPDGATKAINRASVEALGRVHLHCLSDVAPIQAWGKLSRVTPVDLRSLTDGMITLHQKRAATMPVVVRKTLAFMVLLVEVCKKGWWERGIVYDKTPNRKAKGLAKA